MTSMSGYPIAFVFGMSMAAAFAVAEEITSIPFADTRIADEASPNIWGNPALQKGYGIGQELNGDLAVAAIYYKRASFGGNARAMLLLGNAYLHGRGVPKDQTMALAWYSVAAHRCGYEALHTDYTSRRTLMSSSEVERASEIALTLIALMLGVPNDCSEY